MPIKKLQIFTEAEILQQKYKVYTASNSQERPPSMGFITAEILIQIGHGPLQGNLQTNGKNPKKKIMEMENYLLFGAIPLSGVQSQNAESAVSASRRIDGYGGGGSGDWRRKIKEHFRKME